MSRADPSFALIQNDPIGFKGKDSNLYRYVQNNPINWIDPEGLTPQDVIDWATRHYGRHDYDASAPNSEVKGGRGKYLGGRWAPKCNIFVFDALNEGKCKAGRVDGGRIPKAEEWANPSYFIPGCRVVSSPEPGDVISDGHHVGIYVPYSPSTPMTISATPTDGVTWSNWGFRKGQAPTFRRCTCQ
jgi:uncharacterized protein RhaS with RHS repeats